MGAFAFPLDLRFLRLREDIDCALFSGWPSALECEAFEATLLWTAAN